MKCPKCQIENREGAKFCSECGENLEITCPQCGKFTRLGVVGLKKTPKTPFPVIPAEAGIQSF